MARLTHTHTYTHTHTPSNTPPERPLVDNCIQRVTLLEEAEIEAARAHKRTHTHP